MGMIKIPKSSISFFKKNLDEIFDTGFLAEGPWNNKLSDLIKEISNASYAIPTSSNGSGLVSLLNIYSHIYKRKNVLIQSNTMYGVKVLVPAGGCKVVGYIDCQLNSLMPDISDVQNSLKNFTKEEKKKLIILLSHIGGINNPDIIQISELCKSENIILLEDCAHSVGSTQDNIHSGLFGDAGVYSFYSTKSIPVGEGGAIITNNKEIGEICSAYSIYDRFDQKLPTAFNNRISETQALLCFSVLKEWKEIINNKIIIAKKYINICEELGIKYIPQQTDSRNGNYYKFTIYDDVDDINKKYFNIKTKTSPVYDYSIGVENKLAKKHLCLPIWYGQEESITNKVIDEIKKSVK